MTYSFEVNTRSQSLGIIGLSKDRTQRLELMLLLQEKYKMNSVQISDFLNSNNIKTPRNKIYNHKIVWGSIKTIVICLIRLQSKAILRLLIH